MFVKWATGGILVAARGGVGWGGVGGWGGWGVGVGGGGGGGGGWGVGGGGGGWGGGGGGGGTRVSSSRAGRLGRTLWPQNSTSVAETEKGGQNSTMTPPTLEKGGVNILHAEK